MQRQTSRPLLPVNKLTNIFIRADPNLTQISSSHNKENSSDSPSYHKRCQFCDKSFSCPLAHNVHTWSHAPDSTRPSKSFFINAFYCLPCRKPFYSQTVFYHHLKVTHVPWVHFCSLCTLSFESEEELDSHFNTHPQSSSEEAPYFNCIFCLAEFFSVPLLASHFEAHHPDYSVPPSHYQSYASLKRLVEPMEITKTPQRRTKSNPKFKLISRKSQPTRVNVSCKRSPIKPVTSSMQPSYVCNYCGKLFLRSHLLEAHKKTNHSVYERMISPAYSCSQCSASFFKLKTLKEHLKCHHFTEVTPMPSRYKTRL